MSYLLVNAAFLLRYRFCDYARDLDYIIACMVLIIFSGFRYVTGSDYMSYAEIYEAVNPVELSGISDVGSIFPVSVFIEPGFLYFISVTKFISKDFNIFLFLVSLFITPIYLRLFKKVSEKDFLLLVSLYFSTTYMLLDMSGVRQFIAFGFLCLSFMQCVNGRILLMIISIMLGSSFHASLVLLFPVLFLVRYEFSHRAITVLLVLSGVVFFASNSTALLLNIISLLDNLLPDLFVMKMAGYFDGGLETRPRSLNLTMIVYLILFLRFIRCGLYKGYQYFIFIRNITLFYFIYLSLFSFSEDFSVRISAYLSIGPLVILSLFIRDIIIWSNLRASFAFFLCLLLLRNVYLSERFVMYQPYFNYIECSLVECQDAFSRVIKYQSLD